MSGGTEGTTALTHRPRLASVHKLRGLAALLVLVAHAIDMVRRSDTASDWFGIGSLGYFPDFGAIGVDLFFIISGFVMAFSVAGKNGAKATGEFLLLRWVRIAPPYYLITVLMLGWAIVTGSFKDWRGLANAILFVPIFDTTVYTTPPLGIGWTLSFEFSFYLLIAVVVLARQTRRIEWLAAVIVALVAIGLIFPTDVFLFEWFTNPIFLEFALGIVAYGLWSRGLLGQLKPLWIILGVIGLAVLVTQVVFGFGELSEMRPTIDGDLSLMRVAWWGVPAAMIFLGVVAVARDSRGPAARSAAWLGTISYSLYLVHAPALMVVNGVLNQSPITIPADLMLVVGIAAGIVAGWLYFIAVERPVTERLRRVITRRKVAA